MRSSIRLIVLTAIPVLLTAGCTAATGSYFAPTAAIVNGQKVPEADISSQLQLVLADPQNKGVFHGVQGSHNRLDAQRQILTNLLQQEIVSQRAVTLGVKVSTTELKTRIDAIKKQLGGEKAFVAELKKRNLTLDFVTARFREQLLFEKVRESVTKDVQVTDQQIQDTYNQRKTQYDSQIHAAHILVCKDFDATQRKCNITDDDKNLAKSIADRARAGEDFGKLAAEFSNDTSNKNQGGDLGWTAKGSFVPDFENAANALTPGQISDPVITQFGAHVIKLIGKGRSFDEVKSELGTELAGPKKEQAFNDWLRKELGRSAIRINPRIGRFDSTTLQVVGPRGAQQAPRTQGNQPPQP